MLLPAAALLLLTMSGCGPRGKAKPETALLPSPEAVFPPLNPRPKKIVGEDLGRRVGRFSDWGDSTARKYGQSKEKYEALRDALNGGQP